MRRVLATIAALTAVSSLTVTRSYGQGVDNAPTTGPSERAVSSPQANDLRATVGLPALSETQLRDADWQHSTIGLPLLADEFALWDQRRDELAQLRKQRDRLPAKDPNLGWIRVTSQDLLSPAIEVGEVNGSVDLGEIPQSWKVSRVKSTLTLDEQRLILQGIGGSSVDLVSESARTMLADARSLIANGLKIESASFELRSPTPLLTLVATARPTVDRLPDNITVEIGAAPLMTSRTSTVGQFKGGTYITTPGVGDCTSNINVESGGVRYALTAGHCFDTNFGAGYLSPPSWVANGTAITHDGRRIGTFVQSSARKTTYNAGGPWILDAGLIQLDNNSSGTNLYMWRQPGGQNPTAENYYDTVNAGWGNPYPGEMICMEGASHYRNDSAGGYMQTVCGSQGSDVAIYDGNTFVGWQYSLVPFGGVWGSEICREDSGGIIRVPGGGSSHPMGIISGLVTGGHGTVTRQTGGGAAICTAQMRWTPIWIVLSGLGVQPLWNRGSSKLYNTRTGMCFDGRFEGGCSFALEYVPAGSASEADTMLLYQYLFGACTEADGSVWAGVPALVANNYCDYRSTMKFDFVNAGSGRFRLRNVGQGGWVRSIADGRVGLNSTMSNGDVFELLGP